MTFRSDELLIPGLVDKEPLLFDVDSEASLSTWRGRAQDVLQRAGIAVDVNDVKPVIAGRNAVRLILNFYSRTCSFYRNFDSVEILMQLKLISCNASAS